MLGYCTRCTEQVAAVQDCSHETDWDQEHCKDVFVFAHCPKCDHPLLFNFSAYPYQEPDDPAQLYPLIGKHLDDAVPDDLRRLYDEAVTCLRAKAYTATMTMCRATLDGLVRNKGAKAGTLAKALEKLKESGVIDDRLLAWATALRLSGNDAAHEVGARFSHEDAKDALDFTTALLEYVYTLEDRFIRFQARQEDKARRAKRPPDDD